MTVVSMTSPGISFRAFLEASFELAKPRITILLVFIALCSFVITGGFDPGAIGWPGFAATMGSVILLSIGIFTLNQWMERTSDGLMIRTRDRPLPAGRFPAKAALSIGLVFTLGAILFSLLLINPLQGLVAFLTAFGYLLIYTPLKYRTAWHTALGALPGATPPLMGALAVRTELDPMVWILYAMLFLWQFPHFLAIEMIYKDDYAKADIRVLPVTDHSGILTGIQVVLAILALLTVALFPFLMGKAGLIYLIASSLSGLLFLFLGFKAVIVRTKMAAKLLLRASVLYLPMIFLLLTAGL